MSAVPPLSRRVLDELRPFLPNTDAAPSATTPVTRAFAPLKAALHAHQTAFTELNRIEETIVAAHGYPRVRLPGAPGAEPDFAVDASTITRRLGAGHTARRLRTELRQRQAAFAAAANAAGLGAAQAREAQTARELSDATAALLLTPAHTSADPVTKLAVLIAAGEAGPDEALTFPWLYLRALLADLEHLQHDKLFT